MRENNVHGSTFYAREDGDIFIPDSPRSEPRCQMSKSIPLATPFSIALFPVYACNLRCEFCILSLDEKKRGYISDVRIMPYSMFCNTVDSLEKFPNKIKLLHIVGIGEPLMHHDIDKIISYAVSSGRFERVEMTTNGTLLSRELTEKLIDAGLARLRVSVEGNDADAYKKYTKRNIDYDKFVDNLAYYHSKRRDSKLYIKIMDYMLEGEKGAEQFIKTFKPISDAIQIEHCIPFTKQIDFTGKINTGKILRQSGGPALDISVCALPFYMLQLNPDGNVVPCCSLHPPRPLGNVYKESIYDIWNGRNLYDLRVKMLTGGASTAGSKCTSCNSFKFIMDTADILDGQCEKILSRLTPPPE